jgi:NO-binding membrane sensor protein with MHYT domain
MPASRPESRTILLTTLAMLAFAGNSLLCRMGLHYTGMDAVSFTLIRLLSGALMLGILVGLQEGAIPD